MSKINQILNIFRKREIHEVPHVEIFVSEPNKAQLHFHNQIKLNALRQLRILHNQKMGRNIPAIENFFSQQNKKV